MSMTSYGPQPPAGQPPAGQPPAGQPPAGRPPMPYLPQPQVPTARASGIVLLRVLGVLFVVVMLLVGAGSIVAQFFQQRSTESVIVNDPVTRLVAHTESGDIRIRPAAAGTAITVTKRLQWSFEKPKVTVDPKGGVLTVTGGCDAQIVRAGQCSADLDITLPRGTPLELTTGVGDVRTTGATGVTVIETGSGDVSVSDSASADVTVTTGHGDISVNGGAAGARLTARTGTGEVSLRLEHAPSAVTVETGIGDIGVTVPRGDDYRVDVGHTTGEVTVDVPRDSAAPRRISADSGASDIAIRVA